MTSSASVAICRSALGCRRGGQEASTQRPSRAPSLWEGRGLGRPDDHPSHSALTLFPVPGSRRRGIRPLASDWKAVGRDHLEPLQYQNQQGHDNYEEDDAHRPTPSPLASLSALGCSGVMRRCSRCAYEDAIRVRTLGVITRVLVGVHAPADPRFAVGSFPIAIIPGVDLWTDSITADGLTRLPDSSFRAEASSLSQVGLDAATDSVLFFLTGSSANRLVVSAGRGSFLNGTTSASSVLSAAQTTVRSRGPAS